MFTYVFVCFILDAAITVDVSRVFFDGSLGDKGWVLCVTWYLHGPTYPLSWREERKEEMEKEGKLVRNSWNYPFQSQVYI